MVNWKLNNRNEDPAKRPGLLKTKKIDHIRNKKRKLGIIRLYMTKLFANSGYLFAFAQRTPHRYHRWLDPFKFDNSELQVVFQEYYHQIKAIQQRIIRPEEEIRIQTTDSVHAPIIQAIQTLRGAALLTATSIAAEIGSFKRFSTPRQLKPNYKKYFQL